MLLLLVMQVAVMVVFTRAAREGSIPVALTLPPEPESDAVLEAPQPDFITLILGDDYVSITGIDDYASSGPGPTSDTGRRLLYHATASRHASLPHHVSEDPVLVRENDHEAYSQKN